MSTIERTWNTRKVVYNIPILSYRTGFSKSAFVITAFILLRFDIFRGEEEMIHFQPKISEAAFSIVDVKS